MPDEIVKVEDGAVKLALGRFALTLRQRASLLKEIAAAQLISVRRTFREQGSPAGSWAPLAASTLRNKKSKASAGRMILILSGALLNSIQSFATATGIVIGTNLKYARVQQEGSKDFSGAAIGPQAKIAGRSVTVGMFERIRLREIHYTTREVTGRDGKTHRVPTPLRSGSGRVEKGQSRKYQGPRQQTTEQVGEHERHQNIRPRPYLVIRPEDPARIRSQVIAFTVRAAVQAGLQAGGAA
jgi:phage gpG-like protein